MTYFINLTNLSFGQDLYFFILFIIWLFIWKGWALWIAAKLNQKLWFWALLVLNTLGILEILYIFIISGKGGEVVGKILKLDKVKSKFMRFLIAFLLITVSILIFIKISPDLFKSQNLPPVAFVSSEVSVFFSNSRNDPEMLDCSKVYPVKRKVLAIFNKETAVQSALEELLQGPSFEEKETGFFTSINEGVAIRNLKIENKTVKIDFDEKLEFQVGGSCRVVAIRSQIIETVSQFQGIDEVVISINGRTKDILQP